MILTTRVVLEYTICENSALVYFVPLIQILFFLFCLTFHFFNPSKIHGVVNRRRPMGRYSCGVEGIKTCEKKKKNSEKSRN